MTISFSLLDELQVGLDELEGRHLRRRRLVVDSAQGVHIQAEGRSLLNFCANDYLGLANDARLQAAASLAIAQYGVGSGASHLVCGHQAPHEALEQAFARFVGLPSALGFSCGYMANMGVIPSLVGRSDAVFADKLNHASLNEACLLSGASFHRFPHNDPQALERLLAKSSAKRKLIAVDAVYSMDGDLAPIPALLALAERYNAWLYIDDAHGFGVLGGGRGSLAHWQVTSPRLIYLATMGKAAGSMGALVAAEPVVVAWLMNKARTAIYTTAIPAAIAAASLAAMDAIEQDDWRREQLGARIAQFRVGLAGSAYRLVESVVPIQPLLLETSEQALVLSQALWERGLWVAAIRPPTVKTPRLRIALSANHSEADVNYLLGTLIDLQSLLGAAS